MVESVDHDEFSFIVYASSRAEELALWNWDKDRQEHFLRMQYNAQQQFYRQQYPELRYNIILWERQKAGQVAVVRRAGVIFLVDFVLLPEFQNKGIGSWILSKLQSEAARKKGSIYLSVITDSRARRLYERFGFLPIGDKGLYTGMKWE
jgi:GNAT superfamily N-acetyltransferase